MQPFHPGLCVVGGETGGDFPPVRADDGPVVPKKRYLAGRKKGEKIGDTSRQHLPGGPNGGGRPTVGPWRRPGRVRAPERDGLRAAAALAWPGQGLTARRQGAPRVPVDVLGVGGGQAPPPRCPLPAVPPKPSEDSRRLDVLGARTAGQPEHRVGGRPFPRGLPPGAGARRPCV